MPIQSRPYFTGEPDQACERCAFDRGPHAAWCPQRKIWYSLEQMFPQDGRAIDGAD